MLKQLNARLPGINHNTPITPTKYLRSPPQAVFVPTVACGCWGGGVCEVCHQPAWHHVTLCEGQRASVDHSAGDLLPVPKDTGPPPHTVAGSVFEQAAACFSEDLHVRHLTDHKN